MQEGFQEKLWRRDAIWALIVIAAALLFGIDGVSRFYESVTGTGGEQFDLQYLQRYETITFAVLSAGSLILLFYMVAFIAGLRLFAAHEGLAPAAWNLWDVGRAAAASYLGANALTYVAAGVAHLVTGRKILTPAAADPYLIVGNALVLHVAILVLAAGFAFVKGGSLRTMGFTLRKWPAGVVHGVLGYAAIIPVCVAASALVVWALSRFGVQSEPNPILPALEASQTWFRWVIVFTIAVFGPFTEEVFFRGFLYPALKRRLSVAAAILLNAVIFALVHASLTDFLPILVLGAAMAFLFEKTRSLVSCTVFHVCHNSLQMVLFFLIPRQ